MLDKGKWIRMRNKFFGGLPYVSLHTRCSSQQMLQKRCGEATCGSGRRANEQLLHTDLPQQRQWWRLVNRVKFVLHTSQAQTSDHSTFVFMVWEELLGATSGARLAAIARPRRSS